jgi:hypothetical protein
VKSFLDGFRALHEKAKRGALTEPERGKYVGARHELGRLMLIAQSASPGGGTLRARFRVAQMFKVELTTSTGQVKTSTIDVAAAGFAVLLDAGEKVGASAPFTLVLPEFPNGQRRVQGVARVASSRLQARVHRVSYTFADVGAPDMEHIEMVIIDAILARFPSVGL